MRRGRGLVGYVALGGITLLFLGLAVVLLRVPAHASVQFVTVTTTNDNGPLACTGSVCPTLRDALSLAGTMTSDSSNPVEIDLPSGTITLTQGVLSVGSDTDLFTRIKGATGNAGDSVVQEQVTATAGVFSTVSMAGLTTAFQDFTIKGGNAASNGGGVLVGGGAGASATFTNCVLDSNAAASQGGAIAVASPSSLTVATSTFTGNSAHSVGGGVYFNSTGTLQVSGSSFVSNTSGVAPSQGQGGAVYAAGEASATITVSTFTGNQANGTGTPRGGAVFNDGGPMTISLSRFVGNSAALGSNVLWEMNGGSVTANDNWWGTNAGPGTTVAHGFGGISHFGGAPVDMVTNWLQLRNLASPAMLAPGGQATLTADLLGVTGTSTTPLAPGSLAGLVAFPVSGTVFGNPVHGSLSNAATQFVGGVATATFTASPTLLGPASADATADSETATATMTVTSDTTTTLGAAPNPSVFGQPVTFTATVTPTVGGTTPATPTGSVQFFIDNQAGIPVGMTGGSAAMTVSNLSVGSHSVTATYTGDADFNASTSTSTSQVVNKADVSIAVGSSLNPSTNGQSVTFSAAVTATAPGAGSPTGTVQFKDGGTNLGAPVALTAGVATTAVSTLTGGAHTITADYSGDANFNAATGTLTGGQQVNPAATTTSLQSGPDPSVFGQGVDLTATVTSLVEGTITGTVQFAIDGTNEGSPVTVTAGSAALSGISDIPVGAHTVTATYTGNNAYAASTGILGEAQVVIAAGTATALGSSPNPVDVNQPVSFTATVTAIAPGAGTPTGTVQFVADGLALGSPATLNGAGVASIPNITSFIPGTHPVNATYLGNASFSPSTSSQLYQVVNPYPTTTTVTSATNPTRFGQAVTFTATVASSGGGTPTGTVQFWIDGTSVGDTIPLSGGVAALDPISDLSVGSHSVTATYTGVTLFAASTGSLPTQVVNQSNTHTTVSSSANPSVFGQPVTFTATVVPVKPGGGTVTGSVVFFIDGQATSTVPLVSGTASNAPESDLSIGSHTVAAVYQATASYNTSQGSVPGDQVVNEADTTISIGSSANPSVFGQPVSFTVTVVAADPGVGTPTGNVSVFFRGSLLQTLSLSDGSATTDPTSTVHAGTYGVTATYEGDGNFNAGTSGVFFQTVDAADTTTTVVSAMTPTVFGEPVTFTATVTATAPGAGTPTGQVQFSADGTDFGTSPLSGGSAVSPPIASLPAGAHTVTATYVPATFSPGFIFTCNPENFGPGCCPTSLDNLNSCGTRDFNASQGSTGQVVDKADTSTGVSVDINSSVFGQPVTFTATVTATAPGAGTPTGTVQFRIDGTDVGGPADVVGGVATGTVVTSFPPGNHAVDALYSGDADFNPSTGILAGGQTVSAADTATEMGSALNPSIVGQNVQFTATVTAIAPSAGTPTGTVVFTADGLLLGSPQPLDEGGVASVSTTALSFGTHALAATFLGTSDFNSSIGALAGGQVVTKASTTTGLASAPNPSVSGQGVTFTATVTSTYAGSITGQVQFGVDGADRGSPVTVTAGSATLSGISDLTAGTHTVTATYTGDGTYDVSTGTLDGGQTVGTADTTTSLGSSPNPSGAGTPIAFTATVTVTAPGAGTPTGTVQFVADGTDVLGSAPVSGGVATLSSVTSLIPGTHTVTATYSGDAAFNPSTSSAISQTVQGYPTTTTIQSSPNPSRVGQPVTFTATVGSDGGGTPTGTVQFAVDGADVGGPVTVTSGLAVSDPVSSLGVGIHSVTATYAGVTRFATSTGSLPSQTVVRSDTTTTLTPFTNPSVFGQPVTFTATVVPIAPGGGTPTGTVAFFLDGQPLSTVSLVSGTATTDPLTLTVGSHVMTAVYQGTPNYTTSADALHGVIAGKADTTTTVGSSPNPSAFGQPVTFTATVAPVAPGAGGPTGTVSFFVDGALLQTVPLGDGFATADPIGNLAGGNHTVTATYGGDGDFNPDTSAPVTQTVNPAASTVTGVTATVNPSVFGQPVTFTATVAPGAPAPGVPTGQVQFFADGTSFGTGTLSEGSTVSPPISSLGVGAHAVTATYLGDPNFATSMGSTAQAVVQASTTSTVVAAPSPSTFGQPVTFSVTITALGPGAGTPTGTVQFAVDGVDIGDPVTLDGGMATSPPDSGLAVGGRTITAIYSGDPSFAPDTGSVSQTVDAAGTTTTVTSSVNPSSFGQPVSFTATVAPVAPGAGVPTGTVQFFVDGSAFGDPATLGRGIAVSGVTSTLSVGLHPVTATYVGSDDFTASTSDALGQSVGQIAATNVVASTATPSVFGQPVQFVATLTGTQGTPTGSIQFGVDGANLGGPADLTAGVATSTSTSLLAVGPHTVTATYSGDVAYTVDVSTVTQTVNPAATTTGVTTTVNPSVFGQPVTFTATVAPVAPGSGVPTGQVQFFADGTSFGTGTLSGGSTVSPPIASLGVGVHTVTGTYTGDPSFVTSTTSAPVTQTVGQSGSATTVSSSVNPSVSGQPVNFTATIAPAGNGGGTPDGSVQFLIDGTNFGTPVTLSGGSATSGSTGSLTIGNHTVEADYTSGPSYTTSTATLAGGQIVQMAGSSVAVVSSSPDNSSVSGDTVVFTATVGPVAPGAGAPSGSVQFVVDGTNAGDPVALSSGVATYSTAGLSVGHHDVVGNYSGDAMFQSSSGSLDDGQTVASPAMADLSVVTQDPGKAVVGLQTVYGVVVTNNGPNDATGVVLNDSVPAGWTVVGVSSTQGTCTIAGANLSCAIGALANGAQAGVTVVVVPNGPGSVNSTAAVAATQGDPNAANNVSGGTTIVHRFGYWLFGSDGGVFTFGDAHFFGSTGSMHLNKSVVAMTSTPSGQGYWLFASDGGVFAFGDAGFFGSTASMHLNAPIVAMAATPTGHGYWLFASDGGVFAFGDAGFFGSTGNAHLNAPIVAMSSTPSGRGYWLAGADGSVFAFGDAASSGDLAGHRLAAPIVGMAATLSGHGYWLVASDGGVFPFGDAGNFGTLGNSHVNSPITGMAATADSLGYWLSSTDGGVFAFGDAPFLGSMGGQRLNKPMIGLTSNG